MADDEIDQKQLTNFVVDKKSGKIFGFIPLPEPLSSIAVTIIPRAIQAISEGGKPYIEKALSAFALSLKMPDEQAKKIGRSGATAFAYAIPFLGNASEFISTLRQSRKNEKDLHKLVSPALPRNSGLSRIFGNSSTSGNKMVAYARGVIKKDTSRNLNMNTASLAPSVLNSYITRINDSIKSLRRGSGTPSPTGEARSTDDLIKALEKRHSMLKDYGLLVAGGLNTGVQKAGSLPDPMKTIREKTSLGTVLALQEYMRTCGVDCKKLSESTIEKIQKQVVEAFQQFQHEQGRGAIPSHSMNEVAGFITQHLVHGDLSALSLINIIGKEELLNKTKLEFTSAEHIQEVIEKETRAFPRSATIDVPKFLEGKSFTLQDISTHARSRDAEERKITAWLFPTGVLLRAGMKKEEIYKQRDAVTPSEIANLFTVVANEIENLSEADLKKAYEFGPEINKFIVQCAQDPKAIDFALQSADETEKVKRILSSILMGEPSDRVQALITASRELPERSLESDAAEEELEPESKTAGKSIRDKYGIKDRREAIKQKEKPEKWADEVDYDDDISSHTERYSRSKHEGKDRDFSDEYVGSHR